MKNLFSTALSLFFMVSCNNQKQEAFLDATKQDSVNNYNSIDLKDISGAFKYADSLDTYTNCEITDSEYRKEIISVNDSIFFFYDQLGKRLYLADIKKHISPHDDVFLESINKSKKFSDSLFEQDQDLLLYSYGRATGAGYYQRCFKLYLLKKRLAFIKSIVSNSYWNYNFDTLTIPRSR